MKHLIRFIIKTYSTIWYTLKFKKIPKNVKVTTMYGYIYIDGQYFIYDEDATIDENNNIREFRFKLREDEAKFYLGID